MAIVLKQCEHKIMKTKRTYKVFAINPKKKHENKSIFINNNAKTKGQM